MPTIGRGYGLVQYLLERRDAREKFPSAVEGGVPIRQPEKGTSAGNRNNASQTVCCIFCFDLVSLHLAPEFVVFKHPVAFT
jgi:hypothetical protein